MWIETFVGPLLPAKILGYLRGLQNRFVPKGSLQVRFAKAVFWSFLGTAISNAAGLLTAIALARILGRESYGEVGVIIGTYTLFGQLGGLGLGVTAVKYAAQLRSTEPEAVGRVLGSVFTLASLSFAVSSLAMVIFAPDLAVVLNRPLLSGPLRVSGLVLLLQGIDSIQSGILAGYEAFQAIARITILRALVNLPLMIVGAYFWGLYGVIGVTAICGVLTLWLNRNELNQILRENRVSLLYGIDVAKLNLLWDFSFPAFISASLTIFSGWVLNAMLVNQTNGYSEMGLFNAANQWRTLGILIPGVFNSVVLSIQTNLHATKNHEAYYRSVTGNLIVQCLAAALVVFFLIAFSPFLMGLYGSQYASGGKLLMLLALGWFFLTPNWILWNTAISRGKAWWGLLFNFVGAGSLLIFAMRFVESGAMGIARSLLYSGIIQVGLQYIHYCTSKRSHNAYQQTEAAH